MATGLVPFLLIVALVSSLGYLCLLHRSPHHCDPARSLQSHSSKKNTRIVQSDPAGDGINGRVQCSNSSFSLDSRRVAQCGDQNVVLVSLFVPSVSQAVPCTVVAGKLLSGTDRPFAILRAFLESALMAMPGSQQVLLVDPSVGLGGWKMPASVSIEKIAGDYSRRNLMLQRLESYVEFLGRQLRKAEAETTGHRNFVFADSDMVFVSGLNCVFEEEGDFDLGLTFRNNQGQPINSGLIFVRGTRTSLEAARRFMASVVETYKNKFMAASRMMGDQLAFTDVVRHSLSEPLDRRFKQGRIFHGKAGDVDAGLVFLPCSLYNWTPSEGAGQFHGMPQDVKVIHFKGSRKRLMLEAWELRRRSNVHEMKCFVLRSGRAKYDF